MALTEIEQVKKLLENSKQILVVFAAGDSGDAVAAATALKLFLDGQRKQVDIVSDHFSAPKNLKFLPQIKEIKDALTNLQKFIIKVDISKAPIESLGYDVKDNWLSIYLTPKRGVITKQELRTAQTTFKYDLIITLNAPDLESLGAVFENNTDLFYRLPIINIDCQASNERYGQVNLVDITAASACEILFQALSAISDHSIGGELATALLTGMIVATKGFKNSRVTPRALQLASELMDRGADREKIVHHLYRTRSVSALKLWGYALTHLQTDSALGLVRTILTRDDFIRAGATAEDLRGMVEELISNSPEAKITLLLYELENAAGQNQIQGIIATDKNHDALALVSGLSSQGTKRQATFSIQNKTLKEAEEMIVGKIRETLNLKS